MNTARLSKWELPGQQQAKCPSHAKNSACFHCPSCTITAAEDHKGCRGRYSVAQCLQGKVECFFFFLLQQFVQSWQKTCMLANARKLAVFCSVLFCVNLQLELSPRRIAISFIDKCNLNLMQNLEQHWHTLAGVPSKMYHHSDIALHYDHKENEFLSPIHPRSGRSWHAFCTI